MFESLILGAVQGFAEWLPVSSEGMIVLAKTVFFGGGGLEDLVRLALFLHLGTFLAALVYFRHDVALLTRETFRYQDAPDDHRKTINLLVFATLISGAVGFTILGSLGFIEEHLGLTGPGVMAGIGLLLLVTGFLQIAGKGGRGRKRPGDLSAADNIVFGLAQGFAALPGLSRSGLTVSAFLLRGYDDATALRLSFLMSLPIVLGGNIILNLGDLLAFTPESLAGLLAAFALGYLTIDLLMKLARKVNFGWFVIVFGLVTFAGAFL